MLVDSTITFNIVFFRPNYQIRGSYLHPPPPKKKKLTKLLSLMWSVFIHCMEHYWYLLFLLLMPKNNTNVSCRMPFSWEYCLTHFFGVCAETCNIVTSSFSAELLGFTCQSLLVFCTIRSVSNLSYKLIILTLVPD